MCVQYHFVEIQVEMTVEIHFLEMQVETTLKIHIVEEREGWFYEWDDTYDGWNDYYHIPTEENEPGSSHTFTGDNSIFKFTKTKHNGKSKKDLFVRYLHL